MYLLEEQRPSFDTKEGVKGEKSVWNAATWTVNFSVKHCPRIYQLCAEDFILI